MSKLYPCVYCTEDGYCKKYSDEKVKSWCVQGPCKDERLSNADRIRNMTDEELAEFLERVSDGCDSCPMLKECTYSDEEISEKQIRLKWLKQECE